ncbi:MAG: ion transporter [Clostridia bacterium]|nr:ion transporter [Clostridia bacterium]
MLNRIYQIIEPAGDGDKASRAYDLSMMAVIVTSLVPLAFKQETTTFFVIDKVCVTIFIIDYALRLMTANIKLHKGVASFFIYPVTAWAIIDLLSILPSFSILGSGFRVLRVMRLLRSSRVFRALKILRYSKNFEIIIRVFKKQKGPLLAVCILALGYILISALIIFNVEPDSFDSFFEAVYWATVSLTTVGYGDIYPVTTIGRVITMISAILGIAIIALPSGIITAGYMEEVSKNNRNIGGNDHGSK